MRSCHTRPGDCLPPVGRNLLPHSFELPLNNLHGLVRLTLLQRLAAAQHDAQLPAFAEDASLGLLGDELVGLAEDGASLGVAEDDPRDARGAELGGADLAGEGAGGDVVAVLGGDVDERGLLVVYKVQEGEDEERGRGDENLWCRVRGKKMLRRWRRSEVVSLADLPVLGSSWALLNQLVMRS